MRRLFLILVISGFVGCTNVATRIKENERQFGTYAPEAQAQIQNGRIDRGFTEEMVYMAMGKPDNKDTITISARAKGAHDRDGKKITLWKYLRRDVNAAPRESSTGLSSPYSYPTFGPGPGQPAPVIYDRRYYKVEFLDGKVIRWDSELQEDVPVRD